jgi:hypothetical protein
MVALVRSWAGSDPSRRPVKEALFIRLLLPEWQRLLLMLWVWLRSGITERS